MADIRIQSKLYSFDKKTIKFEIPLKLNLFEEDTISEKEISIPTNLTCKKLHQHIQAYIQRKQENKLNYRKTVVIYYNGKEISPDMSNLLSIKPEIKPGSRILAV